MPLQVCTAIIFLRALHARGLRPGGIPLVWAGLPTVADFAPFVDVAWKLFTRTLFKMGAFASISSVAMGLPYKAAATHQVPLLLLPGPSSESVSSWCVCVVFCVWMLSLLCETGARESGLS